MPQPGECVYKISDAPGAMFCRQPCDPNATFQLCEKHSAIFDDLPEPFPCTFCGHRYSRPCSDLPKADKCGNYELMLHAGSVGRINVPLVDPVTVEAMRQADELNQLMGIKNAQTCNEPSRARTAQVSRYNRLSVAN